MNGRILVVGATGLLGGEVTRRLAAAGCTVRALARDPSRIALPGVETVRGDLRDPGSLRAAVQGVAQVFSTANSFMGRGATSPTRVDLPGYRSLVEAAGAAGVARFVHVSAHGISREDPVDYFRVKAAVDAAIRDGSVPWVLLRPSAFMEVWFEALAGQVPGGGPARVFGDGRAVGNFIAVADVAEAAVRVLGRDDIRNEALDLGGPSEISALEFVAAIGRRLGREVRVKRVPLVALRYGPAFVRPFNELAARLMALGYRSATLDGRMPHWRETAGRLGIAPRTVEAWLEERLPR